MNQLILFTGDHCAGCKEMKTRFKALKDFYSDRLDFVEYDVETYVDLARQYGVVGIPAIVVIKNQQPFDTFIGVVPTKTLIRIIEEELL